MSSAQNKQLIYVAGPTASGKTDVAISLADWLKTEIISCDSRQFFKELQIGAAPPTAAQLAKVKHHFVQHLSVTQAYSAGRFGDEARATLNRLFKTHNNAILVGGSGLYANALLYGFDALPKADATIREKYAQLLAEQGIAPLQAELEQKDPDYFAEVDQQNPHRLIRALEVIAATGQQFSALRRRQNATSAFNIMILVMDLPREQRYAQINARVDEMVEAGLEEEARRLLPYAHLQTLNTVGYKEWFAHFRGELSRDETINLIKQNTRRFAKRQLTWFRRYEEAIWVKPDDIETMKALLV